MKSNIIPLFSDMASKPPKEPKPKPVDPFAGLTTSPHFERAWAAYPLMGRTRSSKKQAFPEWKKAAPIVGKEALVAAVEKYAREDKDQHRDGGPPGFHRWLKWGRWEHWVVPAETAAQKTSRRFPDEDIRARLVREFGEPFVVSWLDGCDWVEGLCIAKKTGTLAKLTESPCRDILNRLGITVRLG